MRIVGCRSLLVLACLLGANFSWAQSGNVTIRITDSSNQLRSVPPPAKEIRFTALPKGNVDEQTNQAALNELKTILRANCLLSACKSTIPVLI